MYIPYFWDYKTHFHRPPKFGRKMGGASYSPNVAYLALCGGGGGGGVRFFPLFSSSKTLKPRYVLRSSESYSPKSTVYMCVCVSIYMCVCVYVYI